MDSIIYFFISIRTLHTTPDVIPNMTPQNFTSVTQRGLSFEFLSGICGILVCPEICLQFVETSKRIVHVLDFNNTLGF